MEKQAIAENETQICELGLRNIVAIFLRMARPHSDSIQKHPKAFETKSTNKMSTFNESMTKIVLVYREIFRYFCCGSE